MNWIESGQPYSFCIQNKYILKSNNVEYCPIMGILGPFFTYVRHFHMILPYLTSKNNFKPTFNGIKILKRMKNFSFGVQKIDEIILNEMKIDYKTDTYKVCYKHKF